MREGVARRHYGMDWLRIAAFGLLILHHIAMVFGPWNWVVHDEEHYLVLTPFMAFLMPWRLALLFAVSGYASRALLLRMPDVESFGRSRAKRLLIPLAFVMVTLVPLEMWVRVSIAGYPHGYLHFWLVDYWRAGTFFGVVFPSWQHMWFVAYLATYSLLLAGLLKWKAAAFYGWLDRTVTWLSVGHRLLVVPISLLAFVRLSLMFVVPERTSLLTDWAGHSLYGASFLFGFTIAAKEGLWDVVHRQSKLALVAVACASSTIITIDMMWPANVMPPHLVMVLDKFCRVAMAWSMILLLFRFAHVFWNRDHRWRAPLAEAVFPFYIVHHTAIVLLAWYILPLKMGPVASYFLILTGTVMACVICYGVGSRIGWFRRLIGLGPKGRN